MAKKKLSGFEKAFADARSAALKGGPKTFTWNGKSYNTNLASDKKAPMAKKPTSKVNLPAKAPIPTKKPAMGSIPVPTPKPKMAKPLKTPNMKAKQPNKAPAKSGDATGFVNPWDPTGHVRERLKKGRR